MIGRPEARRRITPLALGLFFGEAAALGGTGPVAASPSEGEFDRSSIERIEDLVEDFANSLHEFSFALKTRDLAAVETRLAPDFTGTDVPIADGPAKPIVRWIEKRPVREPRRGLDREAFLEAWADHLSHFESIEDVRIKIKGADVRERDPVEADARIKFFWLGRNGKGYREWIKGNGRARARRRGPADWVLHAFEIENLQAKTAATDLFVEVALPAGTDHAVPPWGTPGNQVFLARGVATSDVDGDGLIDLLVTGGHENFLYRNRGDGTFENVAAEAMIGITPTANAPLFLDFDEDGDEDLFLAAIGTQMLFENRLVPEGKLIFEDVSLESGVSVPAHGYSALAADVNGDGRPDVFVCSYNEYGRIMPNSWSDATNGTPNLLFLNRGDGTFREVAREWGVSDPRWTYAGQFGDLTGDGRIDLYVANDFGRNAFYVNEGTRFREATEEYGLQDTGNGMGVSLGDFDNDGGIDVHVTNMSSTAGNRILKMVFPEGVGTPEYARTLAKIAAGNTLFRNVGGRWENVAASVGPFSAGWAFGGGFIDFDNDGWEDLHTPNGFISGKGLKDT